MKDFITNDLKISKKEISKNKIIIRSRQLIAPRRRAYNILTDIKKRLVLIYSISTIALNAITSLVL